MMSFTKIISIPYNRSKFETIDLKSKIIIAQDSKYKLVVTDEIVIERLAGNLFDMMMGLSFVQLFYAKGFLIDNKSEYILELKISLKPNILFLVYFAIFFIITFSIFFFTKGFLLGLASFGIGLSVFALQYLFLLYGFSKFSGDLENDLNYFNWE